MISNVTVSHTIYFIYFILYLHPQIAKARQGRRRGKVTAVITDNINININKLSG